MNEIRPIQPIVQTSVAAANPELNKFPRKRWFEDLLKLNPWAEVFLKDGLRIATDDFAPACQLASRARWLAGPAIWNGWAQEMLGMKSTLEAAQLWYIDQLGEGANEETKSWLALANSVFSSLTLERGQEGYIDFTGFIFPGTVWFNDTSFIGETRLTGAKFHSDVHFNRAKFVGQANFRGLIVNGIAHFRESRFTGTADFQDCSFLSDAEFDQTVFTGGNNFNNTSFVGSTSFSNARFIGDATYEDARFTGDALFVDTRFAGTAWFPRTNFVGNSSFKNSVMIGDAWFSDAVFVGNVSFDGTRFPCNSRFENAQFCGLSSFKDAEFSDNTQFTSAKFVGETELAADSLPASAEINTISITGPMRKEREKLELDELFPSLVKNASTSLEGAEFHEVPDFQGTKIDEPPSVARMTVVDPIKTRHDWDGFKKKEPRPVGLKVLKVASNEDDGAKFKALAALAETAQDTKKAREFSVQEKRARRFWHDKPLGGLTSTVKFWFGILHDAGSNYGQSITRPLKIWLVSVFTFAGYYLSRGEFKLVAGTGNYTLPEWSVELPDFAQKAMSNIYQLSAYAPQLQCGGGDELAVGQSISFSLQTSLFQTAPSGALISSQVSHCLFSGSNSGVLFQPIIPLDVTLVAGCQIGLSLLLISLFVHAIWLRIGVKSPT